jgi:hypothetical protein
MKTVRLFTAVLLVASGAFAAEEPAPKSRAKELLKARAAEEAKKPPTKTDKDKTEKEPEKSGVEKEPTPKEAPTVLPQVEVRRDRITVLDREIALLEKEIAREKKHTKQSETDKALNDPKVAKKLSILGGESSSHRAVVAAERVSLMEAERDLLEAMKFSKTKEEKAALQKDVDELRGLRRDLEKSLR